MFSKKSYDGPPGGYGPPTGYGPPAGDYGYDYGARSPPPGSYYIEDVPQHFYKWTSPPGVVRILEAIVILLCIAIFACVASTLAWEYGYGFGGIYGNGLGGYYGSGYYGSGLNYGYGYGGYYGGVTNPRAANGFMIAVAVLCFLAQLGLFVASVSKSSGSRSRRFYLVVIVVSAVLAFIMLIASIVYIVGVNPQAQMTGSYYYNPLLTMCSQIYGSNNYLNQYLYHYCTVDPQEAVAIVCGFLIVILLCLICFFAHKTRSKIWKYGKPNIYWDKMPVVQEGPNVEEWGWGGLPPPPPKHPPSLGRDVPGRAQGLRGDPGASPGTRAAPDPATALCQDPLSPWLVPCRCLVPACLHTTAGSSRGAVLLPPVRRGARRSPGPSLSPHLGTHPMGKEPLKSAPALERGSWGAAVPWPRRGCPGPRRSWDSGQQWTAAWAGAASLSLSPSPSHPHPHPCEAGVPTGAWDGDVYHVYPKPSMQTQSRAQQLLSSPRKLGSAPCTFPHASLCV
uniref:MARVEL domain-containing protein n=1 Tax=Buteo japonicus TaxID=224669 RepID=A0A8C0HNX9_9AVES